MIDGNVNEFVDYIHDGAELVFLYKGQKFFLQGFFEDEKYTLVLDRWEPPADDYIWVGVGGSKGFPVKEFLDAPIWDGRTFWEVERQMQWVDC